ncbi:40S ribosomal protein [Venturia nashicola]|uniref:40S ribosomal protein n=1 Tax=Venturia nashicola TaxID=86259 RepID=A0A4Z1P7Y9_9PEZI|nr:40S ribosomal protein [Venturia nashicola]TLD36897.1 40S ribosomal protein [Venturia nashicola]
MDEKQHLARRYNGPPLPPRNSSSRLTPPPPPAYTKNPNNSKSPYSGFALAENDPRSSSTQSLVPVEGERYDRRTLLLVYIHGFMGNETSFQSFPAHVHNLLSITLAESHVVHTKLYPRYKSRRTISQVSEDFSRWLEPHEAPETDVILLSHSMGGLVAGEIVLLPPRPPPNGQAFRHRILGIINFDVPFLGMHPGVISAGLGSIFKPAPDKPGAALLIEGDGSHLTAPSTTSVGSEQEPSRPSRMNTLFAPPNDPNFNPAFQNDVVLPVREGWRNAWHFVNKHSEDLRQATKNLVKSHMQFGGAMADYSGLKIRYGKVRALEDENEAVRQRVLNRGGTTSTPRVRFVNYYTASTGRPKKPKSPSPSPRAGSLRRSSLDVPGHDGKHEQRHSRSRSRSPAVSIEEHRHDRIIKKDIVEPSDNEYDMQHISAAPISDSESEPETKADTVKGGEKERTKRETDSIDFDSEFESTSLKTSTTMTSIADTAAVDSILGPHFHVQMPNLPPVPHALDLTPYPDKEACKIAQKEHDRKVKAYKQAIKDRDTAIKDREKLEAKMRKNAAKEILKQRNADDKKREKSKGKQKVMDTPDTASIISPTTTHTTTDPSPDLTRQTTLSQTDGQAPLDYTSTRDTTSAKEPKPEKPKKDGKFCMLPSRDDQGERDPAWVRVFMKDMDEVDAHCGLFFLGETYERLVGDVGANIEEWVKDDMTERMVREVLFGVDEWAYTCPADKQLRYCYLLHDVLSRNWLTLLKVGRVSRGEW